MNDAQGGTGSPDDTAAFQRFYADGPGGGQGPDQRGVLYRIFVGWWRDRK